MSQDSFDVAYVAHLARLELTEAEQTRMAGQLGAILGYMEKLKQARVDGVEPMAHAVPLSNVTRPDVALPCLPHEDAIRNAPVSSNGLFIVPKIVE